MVVQYLTVKHEQQWNPLKMRQLLQSERLWAFIFIASASKDLEDLEGGLVISLEKRIFHDTDRFIATETKTAACQIAPIDFTAFVFWVDFQISISSLPLNKTLIHRTEKVSFSSHRHLIPQINGESDLMQ